MSHAFQTDFLETTELRRCQQAETLVEVVAIPLA